jgi:hypothetical protein
MRYGIALLMAAAAFGQTPDASEPWINGSVDFGQRFRTDVRGSKETYRSIVNLNEGPRLFGFDFTINKEDCLCLFDRIDARGANWGDPYNTAYISVLKRGVYNLRFDYRNILYFNALPSFANPGAPSGFNEQWSDVRRRMANVTLDLFPNSRIQPYLAYERNSGNGTSITTWSQDVTNEYPVPTLRRDKTDVYRGGLRFQLNRFHLTLEGGKTAFKDDDAVYADNIGTGNRSAKYFGQALSLSHLQESYGIRARSSYAKAFFTASPFRFLDVSGQFTFSEPKTTVSYVDVGIGNLTQLTTLLLYSGQMDNITGSANKPHLSGGAGFELRPFRRVRIVESWSTDRFHDSAYSTLVQTIYLSAMRGLSLDPTVSDWQKVNYNRNQADLFVDVGFGLTLRGGHRYEWGDATVRSSPFSQTGALEDGQLRRQTAIAGFNFRPIRKVSLNTEYESAQTVRTYFRTSLYNYDRLRARAKWQIAEPLSLQANFGMLENKNPVPGLQYSFRSRDESVSLNWSPKDGKHVSVIAIYDRYKYDSSLNYLLPPFLTAATSDFHDAAHLATAMVDLTGPKFLNSAKLTLGGSLTVSNGTRASRYYEPLGRLSLPIGKHVYWNTTWQWYGFNQSLYLYEGFRTHIFQTGLRLTK